MKVAIPVYRLPLGFKPQKPKWQISFNVKYRSYTGLMCAYDHETDQYMVVLLVLQISIYKS